MSCPSCGKASGHWSNCRPRDPWDGLPDPPERALADLEAEVDLGPTRDLNRGLLKEPPVQGDRVRVPDKREGTCFSVSPGKDNLAPWAFVHFGNDEPLEAFELADLERLAEN